MRQPITFAVVFIIIFTITITGQPLNNAAPNANSKQAELPEGTEAAKAVARLGDLSRSALREKLKRMRPQAYLPDQLFVNKIVKAYSLPLASGKQTDKRKATLQSVLAYYWREQIPIILVSSDQPLANLVDCLAIVITTKLMALANDAEIRGLIAHELAHEYIWDEHKRARLAKDGKLMRERELFCNAVAAFTLKEIGDDPASYARILERLTYIGIKAGNITRAESDTHPSLEARKKLSGFLCQQLNVSIPLPSSAQP